MESLILALEEHKSKSKPWLSEGSPELPIREKAGVQGTLAHCSHSAHPSMLAEKGPTQAIASA